MLRLSLFRHVWTFVSNARYVPSFQRSRHRLQRRNHFKSLVCATSSKAMVGLGGLEPPTSPLSGVRSNHLSYRPVVASKPDGGASRDRTDDPLLAKQVLSQLSYGPVCLYHGLAVRRDALDAGHLCGRLTSNLLSSVSKGGDPAAPSDTATLLRLHPSHRPHRGKRPPCG
jgi:hypothetical protein